MLRKRKALGFLQDDSAATAVECALMLLLIACGLIGLVQYVGENTATIYSNVANSTGDKNFRTMNLPDEQGGSFGS